MSSTAEVEAPPPEQQNGLPEAAAEPAASVEAQPADQQEDAEPWRRRYAPAAPWAGDRRVWLLPGGTPRPLPRPPALNPLPVHSCDCTHPVPAAAPAAAPGLAAPPAAAAVLARAANAVPTPCRRRLWIVRMPRPPEAPAIKVLEQEVDTYRTQMSLITEALNVKKVRAAGGAGGWGSDRWVLLGGAATAGCCCRGPQLPCTACCDAVIAGQSPHAANHQPPAACLLVPSTHRCCCLPPPLAYPCEQVERDSAREATRAARDAFMQVSRPNRGPAVLQTAAQCRLRLDCNAPACCLPVQLPACGCDASPALPAACSSQSREAFEERNKPMRELAQQRQDAAAVANKLKESFR